MNKNMKWLKERIDELTYCYEEGNPVVRATELYNLLEEVTVYEKPSVPDFAYEWIEAKKKDEFNNFFDAFHHDLEFKQFDYTELEEWLFAEKNQDTLAKAWVAFPNIKIRSEGLNYIQYPSMSENTKGCYIGYDGSSFTWDKKNALKMTKQQIVDYDERFLLFAEPVEPEGKE